MKITLSVGALLCATLFAASANAGFLFRKHDTIALSDADITALHGKRIAIAVHDRPYFQSGTDAMSLPGRHSVAIKGHDQIADPAILVRQQLGDAMRDAHGMQLQALDATPSEDDADLATLIAAHPDTDYILDVETLRWSATPFDSPYKNLFLDYHARVRLIDAAASRVVADDECLLSTEDHQHRPLRKMYEYNNAQLAKDVFASFAWSCTQVLAINGLRLPAERLPAKPDAMVDPVGAFMTPRPAAAPAVGK
jgi:hypothetical protein